MTSGEVELLAQALHAQMGAAVFADVEINDLIDDIPDMRHIVDGDCASPLWHGITREARHAWREVARRCLAEGQVEHQAWIESIQPSKREGEPDGQGTEADQPAE